MAVPSWIDFRILIAAGLIAPLLIIPFILRFMSSSDPEEDRAWRMATVLYIILIFSLIIPDFLWSIGWAK